jgi:hypothetical protein
MAETKRKKQKRPHVARTERVFSPTLDLTVKGVLALGAVGAALLGAGVYGQFIHTGTEDPHPQGAMILSAGAVLMALVVLFLPDRPNLAIGDGGVGIDKGPDDATKRIRWCDVERVSLEKDTLAIVGGGDKIVVSLSAHADAAARLAHEADERIPKVVELSDADRERLAKFVPDAGEERSLAEPQVAGKKCKKSGKLITYEEDARLCQACGEVYLKTSLPETCVTCGNPTKSS